MMRGEQALHGLGQTESGARRANHDQRAGSTGELAVQDEEGQSAKVVAVQVGDEHGGDLAGSSPRPLSALREVAPQSRRTGPRTSGLRR